MTEQERDAKYWRKIGEEADAKAEKCYAEADHYMRIAGICAVVALIAGAAAVAVQVGLLLGWIG